MVEARVTLSIVGCCDLLSFIFAYRTPISESISANKYRYQAINKIITM